MAMIKNIDEELIIWATTKIQTEYPEDVALLIGQMGACKLPTDEQRMAFDYFIPATERGNQLAQTFVIEDMGYDLYPISWERLKGIAEIHEPRMLFVLARGEVLYARNDADRQHFEETKARLWENLSNRKLMYDKALEFLNTAMEIYQTMMFEDSMCRVRKASGGVCCYLTSAIALVNGSFLQNGYENLREELQRFQDKPEQIMTIYERVIEDRTIEELQQDSHDLIRVTRDFFIRRKRELESQEQNNNRQEPESEPLYEDLAKWYQEARYTFRKIAYYAKQNNAEQCFMLGCYLQIEFDAIVSDFRLQPMDLMGVYDGRKLSLFAKAAEEIEQYLVGVLREKKVPMKVYEDLDEFLRANSK